MIKVHKDLESVPKKLVKGTVISKRNNLIRIKTYPKSNSKSSEKDQTMVKDYDKRFQEDEIKKELKKNFNNKCVYCEQELIGGSHSVDNKSTVEHYRPKSKYYWLAYSWDNLLWCCHGCNQSKSNSFDILETKVVYSEEFLDNIHNSSKSYQIIENPKMIHPEFESVLDKLSFENGKISSADERVKYTIETCGLDRYKLNEKRKTILKSFIDKIEARRLISQPYSDIVDNLKKDFINEKSQFRALIFWIFNNYESLVEDRNE